MQHRLHGLRGRAYVLEMKRIMAELSPLIRQDFFLIVKEKGKFTPNDLGAMAMKWRLPLTVLDDYLPDLTVLPGEKHPLYPSGTWERLRDRGMKARDIGVEWN